jgi:hypothetical protein
VKRLLAVLLVLTVLIIAQFDPAMAIGYSSRHRVAYAGSDPASDSACSVGWWQTLRYGHVRPRWGIRCLRGGRRRHIG